MANCNGNWRKFETAKDEIRLSFFVLTLLAVLLAEMTATFHQENSSVIHICDYPDVISLCCVD